MRDRWTWSLEGSREFSVSSVRKLLDDKILPEVSSKTRWIKAMPIKLNRLDTFSSFAELPERFCVRYLDGEMLAIRTRLLTKIGWSRF
ncbi:hypothetical protein Tco_1454228 [Tanacetum coccineum]